MKKEIVENEKLEKPQRPFVGDYGAPLEAPSQKVSVGFGMVVLSALVGLVIGFLVWGVFWLSSFLTELLWHDLGEFITGALSNVLASSWWLPVLFCTVGGLIIGLFTKYVGGQPESLEKVMGEVKETGGYKLKKPGASVIGFLLPLVFGGSIGPEAGLTGIIAGACTWIGTALRKAGLRVKAVADLTISAALSAVFASPFVGIIAAAQDAIPQTEEEGSEQEALNPNAYDFRRKAKIVLYTAAGLGAAAGVALFTLIFGSESGVPRFEGFTPQLDQLWWCIPCMIFGYLGALLYHAGEHGFAWLSNRMGDKLVLKPVIAGLVMGVLAIWLPFVLFPGEAQAFELMESWQGIGAFVLIATGLAKCLVTPLCLNFGWKGGHFFPCIFAGIACGYGVAALSGVDPMLCVAIATGTLLAGVQRNALIAMALLLLCFPVASIVWMGLACLLGATAPMPFVRSKAQDD